MSVPISLYRGCLLGLAVGDAMGYTVDSRSWQEIQEDYGPNGLLGYDLVNGYAEITSYTQLAAFSCNGILIGLTRGQLQGKMAPFVRYIALASREWAAGQRPWGRPERIHCWLMHSKELCRRHCMDTRMLDTLSRSQLGTPEEPMNTFTHAGGLTAAVGVGLFPHHDELTEAEIDRLGAETVALTHGNPLAFLSGCVVANLVSRTMRDQELSLEELVEQALTAMEDQFGREYPQAVEISALVRKAIAMAKDETIQSVDAMQTLCCEQAHQVLAGVAYALVSCREDFDAAMITAVNHSGRSAAVGAVTGAVLGARLGDAALPEFYLESLECAEILQELAYDLYQGSPMVVGGRIFDGDWDRKYLHGGR